MGPRRPGGLRERRYETLAPVAGAAHLFGLLLVLLLGAPAALALPGDAARAGPGDLSPKSALGELLASTLEAATLEGDAGAGGGAPGLILEAKGHPLERLRALYEARGFEPVWLVEEGAPGRSAVELVDAIARVESHGLTPESYRPARILALGRQARTTGSLAAQLELELQLTSTFLQLVEDLHSGRVEGWQLGRERRTVDDAFREVADGRSVAELLDALSPPHPAYKRLAEALRRYRALAAHELPELPESLTLKPGEASPHVAAIRARLAIEGDLDVAPEEAIARARAAAAGGSPAPEKLNDALVAGLERFQRRHGLTPDGVIGGKTLAALRTPFDERASTLRLNLERWRWLPDVSEEAHVLVNIPGFLLSAYRPGHEPLELKIITGLPTWETPIFADEIETLTLNPTWTVTDKIAAADILPKVRKDPSWLQRRNMTVLAKDTWEEVNPFMVDWDAVAEADPMPFRFRQGAGKGNPLGKVRFDLPNRYNIFLHDTPARRLFERSSRAFSHGCVRVQEPRRLAELLLAENEDPEILEALWSDERTRRVRLQTPVPIYFVYMTAWVEEDGSVHFRDDVYGWDHPFEESLAKAWEQPAPLVLAQRIEEDPQGPSDGASRDRAQGPEETEAVPDDDEATGPRAGAHR